MGYFLFDSGMFEIIFVLIFVFVIGFFIMTIVQGTRQWDKNNHSPRLDVDATLISKRTDVSHYHNAGDVTGAHGMHTSTSYYATFQVESGDRIEFHLPGSEYGQLSEGDFGKLSFQGSRYLGFERRC